VLDLVAAPEDDEQVAAQVRAFHTFLDEDGRRQLLRQEGGEQALRRIVHAEIKRRSDTP